MAKLKKVSILSFAKMQAIIMAMVGLAAGVLYSFGGAIYDLYTTGSFNWGTALAFMALPGMPVIFAIVGFAWGAAGALLYNLAASSFGGIEFEFQSNGET